MRSIIVIVSMLLSGCASLNESVKLSYDLPKAETTWVVRNPPTEPLNSDEILAARSAAELMTVKLDGEAAYYEGQNDTFAVIRYEQLPTREEPYVVTVKYRIMNGLVYGETIPLVATVLDPQKEIYAREIALRAMNGTSDAIPVHYDGRAFVASINISNSCIVDVVEKDLDRVYATYRIKTC